jgi:hypothetical protein
MKHQAELNVEAEAFLSERIWGGDGDIGLNVEVHTILGESSGQIWTISPAHGATGTSLERSISGP